LKQALASFALLLPLLGSLPAQAGSPGTGLHLELSTENIAASQRAALQAFVEDALASLPPKFREQLDETVRLRFVSELGGNAPLTAPACNAAEASTAQSSELGLFQAWPEPTVELNARLIPEILRGETGSTAYACGHRNFYRLAKASLLHELSHAADSFHNLPGSYNYSSQQRFLDLTDWTGPSLRHPGGSRLNFTQARSPDGYELSNPREAFAVNMEFFLLDETYACRRPRLQAFYSSLFGYDPFPNRGCQPDFKMAVQSPLGAQNSVFEWRDLNASHLYQVQYLFATPGSEAVSSFGHAMFRLVFCAPDRAQPGPDCLKDIKYHVVVSFRANVTNSSISTWDGLTGKYPSELFLLTMDQVRTEYTIAELRELRAYPLLLNEAQKQAFVERTAELFWEYRGRYYFVTSNCASESLRLLRGALDDPRLDDNSAITPKGLYELLLNTGWIDNSELFDRDSAIQKGYLFPSMQASLHRSFGWISKLEYGEWSQQAPFAESLFHKMLASSSAASRLASFHKDLGLAASADRPILAAHFFLLEAYFESRLLVGLQKKATSLFLGDGKAPAANVEAAAALKARLMSKAMPDPMKLLQGGYGIPLGAEFAAEAPATIADAASNQEMLSQLKALLQAAFPEDFAELAAIAANRKEYAQAFR
jgi:Domain of unknown function (DUF4105)